MGMVPRITSILRDGNLDIAANGCRIYGGRDMPHDGPNARPTCCRENNDSNLSSRKVLLIAEIGVGGDKHLESTLLRRAQQFAVLQSSPTKLISSGDTVFRERLS